MKYCCKCQKTVNVYKNTVDMGFAEIWNDVCEECGNLVDSGFEHTGTLVFDLENEKVNVKKENE